MIGAYVGRQPIYKPNLDVFGYELLYRDSEVDEAIFADGSQATAQVILTSFVDIGLENIVGSLPAFINVTRKFILDDHVTALPKDRVIIEVLEDIEPDEPIIAALAELSANGYTIALDDFTFSERWLPLVEIVDIVKVDLPRVDKDELPENLALLRQHDVRIIAEKVETHEEFQFCKELTFDFYQGYFFCRPKVVRGQQIPNNRLATLHLMARLQDPKVQLDEVEEIISTEPSLSYKLLRFVNSATYSLPRKIESIRHAATLTGIQRIKTFASLILMSTIMDRKPRELIATALTRAKMCELLARAMHHERPDKFFTVGLFSVLDALVDMPMPDVLESLPLAAEINDALLHRDGLLGEALQCAWDYERANWKKLTRSRFDGDTIVAAYLQAIAWSAESMGQLTATG